MNEQDAYQNFQGRAALASLKQGSIGLQIILQALTSRAARPWPH